LNLVFNIRQLPLKILKILVGLEFGVAFSHGKQTSQSAGQGAFHLLFL
jgi:hypothetical protein